MINIAELNTKFQSLINGTTGHEFNGVVGTALNERASIVKEVYTALPEVITASINGVVLSFKKDISISGKSINFFSFITNEQYLQIAPNAPVKKKGGAYVSLNSNGIVEVHNGGNFFFKVENKNVEFIG